MLTLTESAIKQIKTFANNENLSLSIRIRCIGSGCVGLMQDIEFDETITDLDEKIEQDGIMIIVDQLSMCYIDDVVVDYVNGMFGSGFKFSGEQKYKSCNCESSVVL